MAPRHLCLGRGAGALVHVHRCVLSPRRSARWQQFPACTCRHTRGSLPGVISSKKSSGILRAAVEQQVASEGTQQAVRVALCCEHAVPFGCSVRIVGSHEALGAWDAQQAQELEWSEGHVWRGDVQLPPGEHELKCVVVSAEGVAQAWQPGPNRAFSVEEGVSAAEVQCSWHQEEPAVTVHQASSGDSTADGQGSSGSSSSQAAESTVDFGASNGVIDHASSSEAASDGTQAAASAETESPSEAGASEAGLPDTDSKTTDAASGLLDPAIPVPEAERQEPADVADRRPDPDATDLKSTDASSGLPESLAQQPRASQPAAAISQPSPNQAPAPASQPSTSQPSTSSPASPEGGVPAWAAILAGLGLPVVSWSQLTLLQTGCGLPPGPSGLLGAAEGLGYLAVLGTAAWSLYARTAARREASAGWQAVVEASAAALVASGIFVLGYQVQTRGYVPGALPDSQCYGPGAASSRQSSLTSSAAPSLNTARAAVASAAAASGSAVQGAVDSLVQSSNSLLPGGSYDSAAMAVGQTVGPLLDAAQSTVQSTGSSLQGLAGSFGGSVSLQQEQLAQVKSGAADGLSAADIASALDEVQALAGRVRGSLGSLFSGSRSPLQQTSSNMAPSGTRQPVLAVLPGPLCLLSSLSVQEAPFHCPSLLTAPTATISFNAATTTAITAASNVTANINTAVMQLQDQVDSVRGLLAQAASVAQEEQVDLTQVNQQLNELQSALCSAKAAAEGLHLQPLVLQLQTAAGAIRDQKTANDGPVAEDLALRLENAASSLSKAASLANPTEIEAARLHIIHTYPPGTYFTAPRAERPAPKAQVASAAEVDKASLAPAVQATEKAAGQLQAAVEDLHEANAALSAVESTQVPPQ